MRPTKFCVCGTSFAVHEASAHFDGLISTFDTLNGYISHPTTDHRGAFEILAILFKRGVVFDIANDADGTYRCFLYDGREVDKIKEISSAQAKTVPLAICRAIALIP